MTVRLLVSCALLAVVACRAGASQELRRKSPFVASPPVSAAPSATAGPIRFEVLDPLAKPPVFVMRGAPRGPAFLVFLHGMCGHGLGYAQAFAFSAAKKGTLIAPQGDVSCGGALAKWSADVSRIDARIVAAFQSLGAFDTATEITLIGLSQGADRAAQLVRRYPQRYTRLISIAAPTALQVGELRSLRGAVMMAGELDRQDLMRQSTRALTATGVPATFISMPHGRHADFGQHPEQSLGAALDWLWSH